MKIKKPEHFDEDVVLVFLTVLVVTIVMAL